jgi:hypothetical protein
LSQITDILNQLQTDNDNNRIQSQSDRMDIYLDDYEDQIKKILDKQFAKENLEVLLPMIARHNNVFKKITNLKSVLYKDEPKRRWLVNGEESEDYSDLIQNSNIASSSITLEKFTNVNNVACQRIVVRNDKIEYDAIPSERVHIEQATDDPMKVVSIAHQVVKNNTSGDHESIWHVWTTGESKYDTEEMKSGFYAVVNGAGDTVTDKQPNPYIDPETGLGIIPYVFFRLFDGIDFWNETMNEDLRIGTLQINVLETHLNNLLKMSGYRQLALIGNVDTKQIANAKTDVLTMINVKPTVAGATAGIEALDQTKDPNQMLTAIARITAILAGNHGVSFSAEGISSGQKQTAEAMTINYQQIINIRRERIPLFRQAEKEQAYKTVIIANTDKAKSGLGMNIDVKGEFMIDFAEVEIVRDPVQEYDIARRKVQDGLMSDAEHLMEINPDISHEEDAIEYLKHVQKTQAEIITTEDIDNEITSAINNLQPEVENEQEEIES